MCLCLYRNSWTTTVIPYFLSFENYPSDQRIIIFIKVLIYGGGLLIIGHHSTFKVINK